METQSRDRGGRFYDEPVDLGRLAIAMRPYSGGPELEASGDNAIELGKAVGVAGAFGIGLWGLYKIVQAASKATR